MAGNGGNSEIKRKIAERIADYEKRGLWDKDVTDDPPAVPLTLDKADYLCEKPFSKTLTKIANRLAVRYFEKEIKKGNFRIKAVHGIENYLKVKDGGAIITCNHFSIYDHYAVYRTIREYFPKGGQLYKVIKEGNYTAFKGRFGFQALQHPSACGKSRSHDKIHESRGRSFKAGRKDTRLSRTGYVAKLRKTAPVKERGVQTCGKKRRSRPSRVYHDGRFRQVRRGRRRDTGFYAVVFGADI